MVLLVADHVLSGTHCRTHTFWNSLQNNYFLKLIAEQIFSGTHCRTNIFWNSLQNNTFWNSLQNKYFLVRDVTDDDDRLSTLHRSLAPNLRRCKGDFPVYGMGQPTQDGLQNFLQQLKDEGFGVRTETRNVKSAF